MPAVFQVDVDTRHPADDCKPSRLGLEPHGSCELLLVSQQLRGLFGSPLRVTAAVSRPVDRV